MSKDKPVTNVYTHILTKADVKELISNLTTACETLCSNPGKPQKQILRAQHAIEVLQTLDNPMYVHNEQEYTRNLNIIIAATKGLHDVFTEMFIKSYDGLPQDQYNCLFKLKDSISILAYALYGEEEVNESA